MLSAFKFDKVATAAAAEAAADVALAAALVSLVPAFVSLVAAAFSYNCCSHCLIPLLVSAA
jgi:hypothetical protein